MLEFGGFNVFFNVTRCKRNTLVSFHFDRGKFSCSFYAKVLPGFSIQKESAPSSSSIEQSYRFLTSGTIAHALFLANKMSS